ncbi:hypothetical protein [Alicyclobacillus herbarius]|uniref:hypothetical protein n=1 Tax=Alicyclobacillus herbarius TaxID=122960 RepID=UPI0004078334|nr:hypothetical protein [Alicyclobacillus herbarius]
MANPEFQSLQPLHSLLSSAVALPFAKAVRELGCADLPQAPFVDEIQPYLDTAAFDRPNTAETRLAVWRAVQNGRVLAVESLPDGGMLFHVQARLQGGLGMDVRLRYRADTWRVQSVTSIHRIPFQRTRSFMYLVSAASVVVAGLLGFSLAVGLHAGSSPAQPALTKNGVESWAKAHGYQLVKPAAGPVSSTPVAKSNGTSAAHKSVTPASGDKTTAKTGAAASTSPKKPAVKTYTYTLHLGTPVHDLSVFLEQHHLVKSAIAFDMEMKNTHADADLRPGTYTFRSNMSESDLIRVLKAGPKS